MQVGLCPSHLQPVSLRAEHLKRLGQVSADHTSLSWSMGSWILKRYFKMPTYLLLFPCTPTAWSSQRVAHPPGISRSLLWLWSEDCDEMIKRWSSWGQLTLLGSYLACLVALPSPPSASWAQMVRHPNWVCVTLKAKNSSSFQACASGRGIQLLCIKLHHPPCCQKHRDVGQQSDMLRVGWYPLHSSQVASKKIEHKPNKQPRKK